MNVNQITPDVAFAVVVDDDDDDEYVDDVIVLCMDEEPAIA